MTIDQGDRLMARLIEVRDGLSSEQGEAFLARLVLLLAQEVDDADRVLVAVDAASASGTRAAGR